MKTLLASSLLGLLALPAFAGGSLDTTEVLALLKKNKPLWDHLGPTLDFDRIAVGVRLGRHWPELGGARIAPYQILVKPKGPGEFTLELTVNCAQRFLDKNGKEIPLTDGGEDDPVIAAFSVEETVTSVQLTPIQP